MAQFYRQIGKRFLKRFQTDDGFVEKKDIGRDSDNILVTADADRQIPAYVATQMFTGQNPPTSILPASLTFIGADATLPGVFNGASQYPPSFIYIRNVVINFYGYTLGAPANANYDYFFHISGVFEDLDGNITPSSQRIFEFQKAVPITASTQFGILENVDIDLMIPYSDVTELGNNNYISATEKNMKRVLSALQASFYTLQFDNTNFGTRYCSAYIYWSAVF